MKYLVYVVIVIVALLLQITIFSFYPIWGVTPDLLLIAVISFSLINGYRSGAYMGFIAGFLQDVFSGGLFGINIVTKLVLGYIFGFLQKQVYHKNIIIPILGIIISTIFSQLLMIVLTEHVILRTELWTRFKNIIFPLVGYHTLLALVIYPGIYYLNIRYFET